MSSEKIDGDDLSLGVSQSATVIRIIVEFELLGHSMSTKGEQSARSDSVTYHFERVRLGEYRNLEHVRLSSSGRIFRIVLADESNEVHAGPTILECMEFRTLASWK